MKKTLNVLLVLFVLLSVLLSACQGNQTVVTETEEVEVVEEPTEVVVEEVEEEPVVEEPEFTEADIDAAYSEFLAGMQAYQTIGLDALNEMLIENPPYLLDVRNLDETEEKGHIPGSVTIPLRELGENLQYLPEQDETIVSYCGSGWRCTIALTALGALGWDVKGLKGDSYTGWVEAGYGTEPGLPAEPETMNSVELNEGLAAAVSEMLANIPEGWGVLTAENLNTALVENPDLILIDVRTAAEVESKGYIEAANLIQIPLEELIAQKDQWPADKDASIAIYCGSGHRSTIAMTMLWTYGYTDVLSLKGGFGGWTSEGYPYEGGDSALDEAYSEFLAGMEAYQTIGLDALNEMLIDNPPYLLDVRNLDETEEKGYIPGSVTIPLRELGENFQYLPEQDETIVSYCGSGWRCTIALTGLGALGWDVKGLKGGSFGGWAEAGYAVEAGLPAAPEAKNSVELDPELEPIIAAMFAAIPEGWGVLTAENLNNALVETPDLILIDVRTAAEVESNGYIAADNVVFIPLEEFITKKSMWPADKDAPIAVYCGSGHRSTIAMTMLWSYGYTDVLSLKDGFGGWVSAGYPVDGGVTAALDAAYSEFLAGMEAYQTISLDGLNEMFLETPPFLLDVRSLEETENSGHIPSETGSVTIPLRELGANLSYLPEYETPIVSYCGSGWRCTIALTGLGALGWDVKGLKGGSFGGWAEAGYATEEGLPADPEVMNSIELNPALSGAISDMFTSIPEGWGVVTADDLNLKLFEETDLILIDVRTLEEAETNGVIESANLINIPLEEFVTMKDMWPADKDAPIVVYCGSGHRSTMAMTILWSYGYPNVLSLKDGFGGWVTAGFPVVEYAQ